MTIEEAYVKKAKPAPPPLPPGWKPPERTTTVSPVKPTLVKAAPPKPVSVPTKAAAPQKATGGYDPLKAARETSGSREEKSIRNAMDDYEKGIRVASDPRAKPIEAFARQQFKKINDFIKKKFNIPNFTIRAVLVWDGAAAGITAGCDSQSKTPSVFFDFSRYLKYPGDPGKYKWKRVEYEGIGHSKIIGDLDRATWQDCVTASICHEFSHAVQFTKNPDEMENVVNALPSYKGNGNDGMHGPLFQAIYTAVRGNIMGNLKESTEMISFREFLEKKNDKKKRKIELSTPMGQITDSDQAEPVKKT